MTRIILDFIGHTDFAAAIKSSYHSPGAVKLAAFFEYFRRQNPGGTLVLDAGDILCGAPIINLTHGEPVVDVVNLFNYDAMTLGNHEFDNGKTIMEQTLSRARFPLLCANIVEKDTGRLLDLVQPYVLVEKAGVTVGILGVTTKYTPLMVREDAFRPFAVLDPVDVCRQYIPQMRDEGADVIVVLGHLPGTVAEDGSCSGELFDVAQAVPGIDILFGGHNPGDVAVQVGDTIVSKTGFSAQAVGHVRIAYDDDTGGISCLKNEILPVLHGELPVEESPMVYDAVAEALAPFEAMLDEVVGVAEDDLIVSKDSECSLGDFFTDCIREVCESQIGLMNATSCFGYIPKGPITAEMIMWVMCFNEHLHRGYMSGRQVREMLAHTYRKEHLGFHGGLQVSGLKVVIDSSREDSERVVSVALESGEPLDDTAQYLMATTHYIASGGNDYERFTRQTRWERTEFETHAVFIDKMREKKRLGPRPAGRIVDLARPHVYS